MSLTVQFGFCLSNSSGSVHFAERYGFQFGSIPTSSPLLYMISLTSFFNAIGSNSLNKSDITTTGEGADAYLTHLLIT